MGNNYNTKRRLVTCTEVDRFSNLPENLIDLILEKLPIQDAVKTHVLSKRWRYKWTSMRSLVLDKRFSEKFAKKGAFGHNGFIRITNQIFYFLKGPILKLHLHIPNMILDSFQEVDQWMLSLSRDGVRELVIINKKRRYQLPCYFFRCLELRKLKLGNCIIKPSLEFQGFLYLKNLSLKNIEFGANLHGTIINIPQLKKLKLFECTNVYNFKIKSTKLFVLVVISCPDATKNIPKWLPHPANSLELLTLYEFKFGDLFQLQGVLCILRNSPNLERLDFDYQDLENMHLDLDVKPALAYLEAFDCLHQTLNGLKTINIMDVERSRPLLLFIKLLLEHSPTLEKISIRPRETSDANEKFNFAKDVIRFPRASSKAELVYLDP
ncbi:F-box/FBD/LRR-repeat protein At1g13570-like [Rutidosis leptorrhynchoides]|uniref:F-box/FBD/LRR-repeat protein At1g13570-like n=1 Tax=Rutidosis leptorrhynchoides TaxID=125765 RepID=UPI003A99E937